VVALRVEQKVHKCPQVQTCLAVVALRVEQKGKTWPSYALMR